MALRGHTVLISKEVNDYSYPKKAIDLPDSLEALGAEVVLGIDGDKHVTGPKVHHILPVFETVRPPDPPVPYRTALFASPEELTSVSWLPSGRVRCAESGQLPCRG